MQGRFPALLLSILLLFTLTAGCAAGPSPPPDHGGDPGPPPGEPPCEEPDASCEPMDFEVLDRESLPGDLVARLGGSRPDPGMLTVQEGGYTYISVSAGRKPTDGYSVRVADLTAYPEAIVLNTLLFSPCETETVAEEATYPSVLIRFPADEREVIHFSSDTRDPLHG